MKYLKVVLNDGISEDFANSLRACYKSSVKSVEICDEVQVPEIKKTEIGILDLSGLPDGYQINRKLDLEWFSNGDVVDLGNHPKLKESCYDIKSKLNFDTIKEGSLIIVTYADHSECGYVHIDCVPYISQYSDLSQFRRYIADTAISIRIVEVPA